MAGRSSTERRALDGLAETLLAEFEAAGFEFIDPDILQPADVFLERSGEDIRARTFVFTDPEGRELCLRPDLTVPACRVHLARHPGNPETAARYCYAGPVFRHQGESAGGQPSEFHQAGIEWFGTTDHEAAEAEILVQSQKALVRTGLAGFSITLGDLGLFYALLRSIEIPGRWRRRLKHQFWRPRAFRSLLQTLAGTRTRHTTSVSPLIDRLGTVKLEPAMELVDAELSARQLALVGGRTVLDIAERLMEKAADRQETPLKPTDVEAIDAYLAIRATASAAEARLDEIVDKVGAPFSTAVGRFKRRNQLLSDCGLDPGSLEFAAVFGRSLEYYTGFVFQIDKRAADGRNHAIAGGGRYDDMISDIAGGDPVPAVGCGIHLGRLLASVDEAAS